MHARPHVYETTGSVPRPPIPFNSNPSPSTPIVPCGLIYVLVMLNLYECVEWPGVRSLSRDPWNMAVILRWVSWILLYLSIPLAWTKFLQFRHTVYRAPGVILLHIFLPGPIQWESLRWSVVVGVVARTPNPGEKERERERGGGCAHG